MKKLNLTTFSLSRLKVLQVLSIKTVPVKSSCMISLYVAVLRLQTQPFCCQISPPCLGWLNSDLFADLSVLWWKYKLPVLSVWDKSASLLCSRAITRGRLWFVSWKIWLTGLSGEGGEREEVKTDWRTKQGIVKYFQNQINCEGQPSGGQHCTA